MKLLRDENVSPRLVARLSDAFPGSTHVSLVNLRGAADSRIWSYALDGGFVIVSKDSDFRERSSLEGSPPKVAWLDVGNAGSHAIADLLRNERARMERFDADEESSFLILSLGRRSI